MFHADGWGMDGGGIGVVGGKDSDNEMVGFFFLSYFDAFELNSVKYTQTQASSSLQSSFNPCKQIFRLRKKVR